LQLLVGQTTKNKDEDRLLNASTVLKEILNIPDDIPQDLLDKADCLVVFPSVLKAAFVVGGSYGRGAMTCRTGESFNGPWGAPSMMALEGGQCRLSNWRASDGLPSRDE
jgi:lipid-binding SYLF domain-containing protein